MWAGQLLAELLPDHQYTRAAGACILSSSIMKQETWLLATMSNRSEIPECMSTSQANGVAAFLTTLALFFGTWRCEVPADLLHQALVDVGYSCRQ